MKSPEKRAATSVAVTAETAALLADLGRRYGLNKKELITAMAVYFTTTGIDPRSTEQAATLGDLRADLAAARQAAAEEAKAAREERQAAAKQLLDLALNVNIMGQAVATTTERQERRVLQLEAREEERQAAARAAEEEAKTKKRHWWNRRR